MQKFQSALSATIIALILAGMFTAAPVGGAEAPGDVVALEQAAKAEPESFRARFKLAEAMLEEGRFRKAEESFLACTLLKPHDNSARFGIAEVYEHTGRFADAVLVYQQILKRVPLTPLDQYRAQRAMHRLSYYHSLGSATSSQYSVGKDIEERSAWNKKSFPLKIAIWSDPEMKELKEPFHHDVVRAFERWQTASGNKTRFEVVNDQRSADIVCKLVRVMRGNRHDSLGEKAGETSLQWDDRNEDDMKWSRIEIFWDERYTPAKLEACVLHEVGHALGLNHSSNPHDIMFPLAHPPYAAILSDRDKNSMFAIYATR